MKCHIYLSDDMMNHITAAINQPIKMDKWFLKWCVYKFEVKRFELIRIVPTF